MKRDDELTRLALQVRATFGPLALREAYLRALSAAPAICFEELPMSVTDFLPEELEDTTFVNGRDAAAALKAELQRMLKVH